MAKIYIAGPISGLPNFNRDAFNLEAERLHALGHIALNPAILPDGLKQHEYMAICIEMVLPPLTTFFARRFCITARPIANRFTPGCILKYWSSNSIRQVENFSGIVSLAGNRHCPSEAIRAPSNCPSLASTTVEQGFPKRGSGASKIRISVAARKTIKKRTRYFFVTMNLQNRVKMSVA